MLPCTWFMKIEMSAMLIQRCINAHNIFLVPLLHDRTRFLQDREKIRDPCRKSSELHVTIGIPNCRSYGIKAYSLLCHSCIHALLQHAG